MSYFSQWKEVYLCKPGSSGLSLNPQPTFILIFSTFKAKTDQVYSPSAGQTKCWRRLGEKLTFKQSKLNVDKSLFLHADSKCKNSFVILSQG